MEAVKENKVYRITEDDKKRYLEDGYDVYGDDGKLLEYSPKKKMTFSEHKSLMAEAEQRIKELEDMIKTLREENEKLASDKTRTAKKDNTKEAETEKPNKEGE